MAEKSLTRWYRRALRLLPPAIRAAHGDEMAAVFDELLRDRQRRSRSVVRLASAELFALVRFAWCAHRGLPPPRRIDERQLAWPREGERTRPMRESLLQDLHYGIRLLARAPGFTLICVLTMALAIGANTAVFSVVHGVLLEPLPYPHDDQLVVLGHYNDGGTALSSTTPGNFYDWQSRMTAFEAMAGFAYTQRVLSWGDNAERVTGALSASSIFDVLGRTAAQGRTFVAADDGPGAPPVVVLSSQFARRVFGDAPAVGGSIAINSIPFTVIGVMPADFAFPDYDAQYWLPARFDAPFRQNRDQYFLLAIGRLKGGVAIDQSRTQLDTVMDGIRRDHPQFTQSATGAVVPMKEFLVGSVRPRLWALFGAVVCVLLIACANIANLLLARGATRRRELAVRHALGARPRRLVRQMLTESLLLATIGGAAGLALGAALVRLLVAWLPDDLPRLDGVGLNPVVLAATMGIALVCGIVFGLWPALRLSGDSAAAIREGGRGSIRTDGARTGLVIAEVALCLLLLAGAGLLVRSFVNLLDVSTGFQSERLLTFSVSTPTTVYRQAAERLAYFENATGRLRTLPGVTGVVQSSTLPVAGRGIGAWFNILDRPLPPDQTPPAVPYRVVTPGYFDTLAIPLKRGRALTADDGVQGMRAVVISEAVARRFWPDGSALGRRIYLGAPDNRLFADAEIVGIVGDVKQTGLDEETSEAVYIPHRLMPFWSTFSFAIRTAVAPASIAAAVRAELRQIDASIPIQDVRTMDDIIARSVAPTRSSMFLLGLFAAVALVLAVVGVFGLLSYYVSQHRTEMAIRVALGAPARSVMLQVFGQGMRNVAIGIGVGLALCVPLGRWIESLLFNLRPTDPATLLAVSLLLAAVAAVAIYIPGRRAARVDPLLALRETP